MEYILENPPPLPGHGVMIFRDLWKKLDTVLSPFSYTFTLKIIYFPLFNKKKKPIYIPYLLGEKRG